MKWIVRFGDYLMSLSNGARFTVVVMVLVLLGGGGVLKLITSINRLSQPLPAASPDQLIQPMQKLFMQPPANSDDYQRTRRQLDSLRSQTLTPNALPQ